MSIISWVCRHPILAYILLTLTWSWIWSFMIIKPGGLMNDPPPLSFLLVVVGGLGPFISARQHLFQRLDLWPAGCPPAEEIAWPAISVRVALCAAGLIWFGIRRADTPRPVKPDGNR